MSPRMCIDRACPGCTRKPARLPVLSGDAAGRRCILQGSGGCTLRLARSAAEPATLAAALLEARAMDSAPPEPPVSSAPPPPDRKTVSNRVKRFFLGAPKDLQYPQLFHNISLAAFLAWVG